MTLRRPLRPGSDQNVRSFRFSGTGSRWWQKTREVQALPAAAPEHERVLREGGAIGRRYRRQVKSGRPLG